jgi:excisionase family DNA binding protein
VLLIRVPSGERPGARLTLTLEEAARALGISRAFAYEAVARGEIPCIRIGKRILVSKAALVQMPDANVLQKPFPDRHSGERQQGSVG